MVFENLNWLIFGILIGLFVPITLLLGNKQFGISSSLENICSVVLPKTKSVFADFDNKKNDWKLYFVIGILLGGFFTSNFLSDYKAEILPDFFYSIDGIILLFIGGLLVGFGTRYAKGCTSGHSITGLSMLQLSSLAATISFFVGGLIYTWIL